MRAKKEVSFTFDIPRSSIGLSTNGSAALAAMRSRAAGLQTRDFSVDEANKAVVPLSPASEIDSQYALLLKYSDKARVAEQRLVAVPDDLLERFKMEAVNDPSRIEDIVTVL